MMTSKLKQTVKNGALIEFSSAYQIEHFLRYPLRYLIQLTNLNSGRSEHIAIIYNDYIYESLLSTKKVTKTLLAERIAKIESQIETNCHNLVKPLTKKEAEKLEIFLEYWTQENDTYSIWQALYTILDKIPFFNLIKIPENQKSCSKFFFQCYQTIGRFPADDNANNYTPSEVISYAKKLKLLKRRVRIDKLS